MRFRGTTIRRKIVALLLIPLVSLTALWAFAATLTSSEVWNMLTITQTVEHLAHPVEDSMRALQHERRDALVLLADPRRSNARSDLLRRETATDKAVELLRAQAALPSNRNSLSSLSLQRLDTLTNGLDGLDPLRRRVENGAVSRSEAYNQYNLMVDPVFDFLDAIGSPINDVEIVRPIRALTAIVRADDNISREDALMAAAITAGRTSGTELRDFAYAVGAQRAYYRDNLKLLHSPERSLFTAFWNGTDGRALRSAEDAVITAGVKGAPRAADRASWQTAAATALSRLDTASSKSRDIQRDRTEPIGVRKFVIAGVAGGLGLVAVIASVIVSVRIGRRLIRDLTRLRREAQEVSGTRLPRVMRRLAAGEEVDVETEAPRLDYSEDEVGQVGKALNTLQRAAVEAAVRQADMRRGVSDVFVNLARRSQVLLHRQLTLLDAMERRTENPRELADLFRLDHMTTRMRRHAEGLVILSGAVPSRQWRKPVQLMDVVRAAVAEVEDYERVEVRRMTGLALVGQAVADITHLIAELVENATVFSPPHTTVQVHGEQVANGFALEVDDRGLGLTPDAMLEANLRLAETPEFELSDTDRLGLFVVSRLAQRQGVRVSLKPSPYGGTTAVVLIPSALLTSGAEESEGSRTGELELAAGSDPVDRAARAEHSFRQWGLTGDRGEEPREHRDALDPVSSTGRTAGRFAVPTAHPGESPTNDPAPGGPDVLPRRRRAPVLVAENGRPVADRSKPGATKPAVPGPGAAPGAFGPPATVGGGLPRRVRQASLAPQLRTDAADETARTAPDRADRAVRERSPEEVRSRMASFQRGWQRGRSANDTDDALDAGPRPGDSAPRTTTEGNGP